MRLNIENPLYQADLENILSVEGISSFIGKSFLITGATGMIGSCLIDALMLYNSRGADIQIIAVGRNATKARERFSKYWEDELFSFLELDVRQSFPDDLTVDYIIPLASNTHPLAYSQFPIETIFINVDGARNALDLASTCGAVVLYPSSVEIYGNARDEAAFKESDTGILNLSTARSCYTESKRLCEALCQSYISERGVDARIVRLSRVFGPTMLPDDSKASSQFINKALVGEDIVLKSSGEQYFSYTYVADAVSAILFVLLHGEKGTAYNVSVEECNVHLKEFATICAETAGTSVVFDLPSEEEKKGYSVASSAVMDNSRLRALGWQPQYTSHSALERTLQTLAVS